MDLNAFATRSPAQPLNMQPKVNAFTNMTAPAPAPVAAQAQRPTANAFVAPMRVQPKAPEPSMAGRAIKAFTNGFVGRDQVAKVDDRYKADAQAKAKSAMIWLQQTAAQPAEQRAAFTLQSAQDIARDTDQPYEAIVASAQDPNAFSDEQLNGAIAKFSAMAGMAPNVPEPMSAYQLWQKEQAEKNAGNPTLFNRDFGVVAVAPNGRESSIVPGTESTADEKPPWTGAVKDESGNWIYDPDYISGERSMRASTASGGMTKAPSGYRWAQDENGSMVQEAVPGGPADKGLNMNPQFIAMEMQQAKDWKGVYNNFADINNQAGRIRTMAARKDPAGDLALIVSFTKMLDPGSVAREGEVALTQSAASALQQAQNWLPRLEKGGTLLPDDLRSALLNAANEMYGVYEKTYHDLAGDYTARAQAYGFAPERVLMGYRPSQAMQDKAAVAQERGSRSQHSGGILGGTGEFNPGAFANMRLNNIPRDAVADLRADPSPEAIAEFNEHFKMPGAAEAILNGNR